MSKKISENVGKKKVTDVSSVTLTAVALQDHWSRTLSLGANFGPKKVYLGPTAGAKQKSVVRSRLDTGLHRDKRNVKREEEKEKDKEYILDEKPPALTLAQKFGLIRAPKPLLSEDEWSNVKDKSNKRDDSGDPCVICKEDFCLQEQVLLSCTHVFHRACLQAFERFTGRKSCPMCRREQYQTRIIHEGARLHRHKCATKIQSQWRGYVVRYWYKQLRETVPPKDPLLRKKFYEEKLSAIVDRMIRSIDVSEFLREIDSSVQHSRAIFDQWDAQHMHISDQQWETIQLKAVERGDVDCPICLTELQYTQDDTPSVNEPTMDVEWNAEKKNTTSHRHRHENKKLSTLGQISQMTSTSLKGHTTLPHTTEEPLTSVTKLACPSCEGATGPVTKCRSTVLLSCTHVFHTTCLRTLEDIAMLDIRNTCPVCRAHYQKKFIVH